MKREKGKRERERKRESERKENENEREEKESWQLEKLMRSQSFGQKDPKTEDFIQRKRDRGEADRERGKDEPKPQEIAGARPETEDAGGDRRRGSRSRQEQREGRETESSCASGSVLRAGGIFKNAIWAHRTVYSACPVHTGQCTVAVR